MPQLYKTTVNGEVIHFTIENRQVRFPQGTEQCEDCAQDIGETAVPIKGMDDRFACSCGARYVGEPAIVDDEEEER